MAQVTVPCFAKLNLDLRVLDKRSDGYHELRTIFQTISLQDTLSIEFELNKQTQIELSCSVSIDDNVIVRAARTVLDHLGVSAWVRFALEKKIPIGAGLGGGSSDAAAVLLALPALAGKRVPLCELARLGESLGSDVPFFLYGGTALALGRGTEVYPLVEQRPFPVLVVSPDIHVSTKEAYDWLDRHVSDPLTSPSESSILREFQTIVWDLDGSNLDRFPLKNDFERAVFGIHNELPALAQKLRQAGAQPALMTGSGSALFGVFRTAGEMSAAACEFPPGMAISARFVSRRQYRRLWRLALGPAADASCFAR